jgi:dihydrofolate reductase
MLSRREVAKRGTEPMRKLIADLFISLDGYAAGENVAGYFGMLGPELEEWVREHVDEPEELVMGRRTYEMLAQFAISPDETDESPSRMDELPKIVLSHTLRDVLPWTPARVISGDLTSVVGELKRQDGPMLRTIGSISVVRDLIAAGLLDRLRLVVFPIVLGGDGREPAFADHPRGTMELVDSKVLDGRLIALEYRPTMSSGAAA